MILYLVILFDMVLFLMLAFWRATKPGLSFYHDVIACIATLLLKNMSEPKQHWAGECRLCKKNLFEIKGYLHRVNPKGEVPAVWECRPSCTSNLNQDEALFAAIEGT